MKRNATLMLVSLGGSAVLLVVGLFLMAAVSPSVPAATAVLGVFAVLACAFAAVLLAAVRRGERAPVPAHAPTPDDEFRVALAHRLAEEMRQESQRSIY